MRHRRPTHRLAPGSGAIIAILLALVGLAGVLAYQALDAARAEARATQRELRGFATLASVQLARDLENAPAAGLAHAAANVRTALSAQAGHLVLIELWAPDGTPVYRTAPPPAKRAQQGSWLEAKVGLQQPGPLVSAAVTDTLHGALAGYVARVAVMPGSRRPGAGRSRLSLLVGVFGMALGLVAIGIFQLRRQQELVRLRADFISGVSHELRTPLAQIRLFADLLESGRLADRAQRERSVRVIAQESRRLSYLVENVLHFSRRRERNRIPAPGVEAAPIIHAAVEAFEPLAGARGVRVVEDLEDRAVAPLDRDALTQVLLNLLDNAVKYGPEGQTIQVAARVVDGRLRVSVRDEGPGVPWSARMSIWDPYRRLTRDEESSGCGIGLSVVRELVELHGGSVAVEEAPGGGAQFVCHFPGAALIPVPARVEVA